MNSKPSRSDASFGQGRPRRGHDEDGGEKGPGFGINGPGRGVLHRDRTQGQRVPCPDGGEERTRRGGVRSSAFGLSPAVEVGGRTALPPLWDGSDASAGGSVSPSGWPLRPNAESGPRHSRQPDRDERKCVSWCQRRHPHAKELHGRGLRLKRLLHDPMHRRLDVSRESIEKNEEFAVILRRYNPDKCKTNSLRPPVEPHSGARTLFMLPPALAPRHPPD